MGSSPIFNFPKTNFFRPEKKLPNFPQGKSSPKAFSEVKMLVSGSAVGELGVGVEVILFWPDR